MTENNPALGRPARELTDEELERQGKNAHETRNWVFLNGTRQQFATHTARMLELEQEYLRRHPKRTWQGSGGAPASGSDLDVIKAALRGVIVQLTSLLEYEAATAGTGRPASGDPITILLSRIAAQPGGRMNKLEVHQVARELGLDRTDLAKLYTVDPKALVTEGKERVITDAGRQRLADADVHA